MRVGFKLCIILTVLLFASATVSGQADLADFNEDFEDNQLGGFEPDTEPDQDWYNFRQGTEIAEVSEDAPTPEGTQSLRIRSGRTTDTSNRFAQFDLVNPNQLTDVEFLVEGVPPSDDVDGIGSSQIIILESGSPRRELVRFFLICSDAGNPGACELRVKFDRVETIGEVLVNTSVGQTQFKIRVVPDWDSAEYRLFVDDVDDGIFPFLESPGTFGRIKFQQHVGGRNFNMSFDDWTVTDAIDADVEGLDVDIAQGLQNFADDIRFTTTSSLFFLGLLFFIVLIAAVLVPLFSLSLDNTLVPAVGFYAVLCVFWLIFLEFWEQWVGITLIIIASSFIAAIVRRGVGITSTSFGASIVVGTLGYFIVATSLLGFSGYATDTITTPTGQPEIEDDEGPNSTQSEQGFLEATAECFVGIVKSGWNSLINFKPTWEADCSKKTESEGWKAFKENIAEVTSFILNLARTGIDFVYQLLTFQLPILPIFNVIIITPLAIGLATLGIMVIRGGS